ncbi:hypothetical protein Tco_0927994, partial [Tanacetum coccineum]
FVQIDNELRLVAPSLSSKLHRRPLVDSYRWNMTSELLTLVLREKQVKIVPHTVKNPKSATVDNLTEKANRGVYLDYTREPSDLASGRPNVKNVTLLIRDISEEANGNGFHAMQLASVSTALLLAADIGIFEGLALYFVSRVFLNLMGISSASSMHGPTQQFISLRTIGAPAVVLSLALQGVFRGFKDIKTPVLWPKSLNMLPLLSVSASLDGTHKNTDLITHHSVLPLILLTVDIGSLTLPNFGFPRLVIVP